MPTRDTPPNVLKILLVAVLGCALAFALVVGGGIYWFVSSHAQPRRTAQHFPPGPGQPPQPPLTRVPSEPAPPRIFTRNAILRTGTTNAPAHPGDDIFKDVFIPRVQLSIPREGISSLNRRPREYVRATLQEGDRAYTVAIRLKGGPGSYQNLNEVPSFTVNFDKFAPGQTFHGLKKIHLNNSRQDNSYLEEKISRELFDAAGVPAPRAGHAHVTFNGRVLGLYVLVEGVNKPFLRRYFKEVDGNVYDGHSGNDVTMKMETNSGENRSDQSRLRALASAARKSNLEARLASLETTLDLDRFLSYAALEMILWHWDGYTMARNNFRIFHDLASDRMVFFPQGMDQMLTRPKGAIFPETQGLVARAVLEIPEMRRRYQERVAELLTKVVRIDVIGDRINEVSTAIEAVLAETDPGAEETHRQRANALRRRFQQRVSYLESQLFPPNLLKFDELATAPLTDWKPRRDLGESILEREENSDDGALLRISTTNGCTASWRTIALLPAGKYQFEARVRTQGVVFNPADERAGAGLRISRHRVGQKNSGDNDWMPIVFEFEVAENPSQVELICELRADRGEIWYDLDSLKVRKL